MSMKEHIKRFFARLSHRTVGLRKRVKFATLFVLHCLS